MKSNEQLINYKFILPNGSLYESDFKSTTQFRSVKISLIQHKKVAGTLQTIKFIVNHQYAKDNWKLESISKMDNKLIYVEHGQKSFAVNLRFLKDNNKPFSAFFAKTETVYDVKKYLSNEYFFMETNNDPSKILLFKGETLFGDNSVVEDMNIRKHDCIIVLIKEDNDQQFGEETDEFNSQKSEISVNTPKKERRSPRHFNLKFSGKYNDGTSSPKSARESKIVSNEFMHCQPIRASFPDHSNNASGDNQDPAIINYSIIGNAQISKPKTKKTKESPPVRLTSYKSSNEKSRIPAKRPNHNFKKSGASLSTSGSPKSHQQLVSDKGKKVVLIKPENNKYHSKGKTSPKKGQSQSLYEPELEVVSPSTNFEEEEGSNDENNSFQFEISNEEEESDDDDNMFVLEDDNNANGNSGDQASALKLPLPFQLPNGSVQSVMLTSSDTIGDVKNRFAQMLNCDADTITLNLKGQDLTDDAAQVMNIAEYHGTTPIMIVVHVNQTKPGEGKIQYFFRINRDESDDEQLVALYFEPEATVKEAREAVAAELGKEAKEVTLIYNCKNLADKILLRKLRIPVDGCIIVLVENSDELVRLSTPLTVMKPRKPFMITFLTADSTNQKIVIAVPPLSSVGEIKEKVAEEMTKRNREMKLNRTVNDSDIPKSPRSFSNSETVQKSSCEAAKSVTILSNTSPATCEDSSHSQLSSSVDDLNSKSFVPEQIDFFFGGKMLTDDLIFDGLGVHDGSKIVVNTIRPTTAKLSRSLRLSSSGCFKPFDPESSESLSIDEQTDDDEDIDKWEDELYQEISALELVKLQKMPPKGMPDAQKVIIYFRCNRDMKCTRRALKSIKW